MCGIAGITGLPGHDGAHIVRRMAARLTHRGPDDAGEWHGEMVAFSHRRLSILDLSPAGHQPMIDETHGLSIVYNGEVYNFREVAEQLQREQPGLTYRSRSDTEVLLRAYARWGPDCVRRFRGMFAFAVWDQRRQELFLARDRLGIKPLYYYAAPPVFAFASEIRALMASGLVRPRLDPVAVSQYLACQAVPAPRTLIDGIRCLPPGCSATVDGAGRLTERRYWDLFDDASVAARGATPAQGRNRVGELLRESIALHMTSDVPVGVFLSGGIDSSALVAVMREVGVLPRTFTVVFAERAYDERRYARAIARRFRTDHAEILLREHDLLDRLPDALAAMDQVSGDAVNTYMVSRAVREAGLTVALSGLGGDEFFAGYPTFRRLRRAAPLLRRWGALPPKVRLRAGRIVRRLAPATIASEKIALLLESDGSIAAALPIARQVLSPEQRQALLCDRWLARVGSPEDVYQAVLGEAFARARGAGLLACISYGEARTYMHDVLLRDTDQMSMSQGLEVRVPLLDHALVEYVMGLPDEHKVSRGVPKRLLVDSLDGLLPPAVVRRRKQGFTLPFAVWMRGELRGFCEERLAPNRLGGRGIFDPARLLALWQAFLDGRGDVSWSRVWVLVVLEDWIERNGAQAA